MYRQNHRHNYIYKRACARKFMDIRYILTRAFTHTHISYTLMCMYMYIHCIYALYIHILYAHHPNIPFRFMPHIFGVLGVCAAILYKTAFANLPFTQVELWADICPSSIVLFFLLGQIITKV